MSRIIACLIAVFLLLPFMYAGCGDGGGGTPASKYLFVGNTDEDTISRYTINADTGELSFLGTTSLPYESGPTGLVMDPGHEFLYVANSNARPASWGGNGTVSVFQYNSSTGDLIETPNSPFPASSMALQIAITPSGEFLYTTDQAWGNITIFEVDSSTGDLTETAFSPMTETEAHGIAMHPSGDFLYVANEDDYEIGGYSINADTGALTPVPNSPYDLGWRCNWVSITPDGDYVYCTQTANAGGIAGFSIDNISGQLTTINGFPISAPGANLKTSLITNNGDFFYVAQWNDNSIMGYTINGADGTLTAIPNMPAAAGTSPKALAVDNKDQFLYAANYNSDSVDLFTINDTTGELTYVDTYTTGDGPKVLITVP